MARHKAFLSRLKPVMRQFKSAIAGTRTLITSFLTALLLSFILAPSAADAASRSLTLHNTHTKETTTIVFKRNGRYDPEGLRKLNRFLRDWRRNESTRMDPVLFDLMWHVYKETGAKKPIHVVSGYRSPATNNMLRSRSRGVAKNSRHTKGQAMDFYLPGVPIRKVRDVGLRLQAGGVGYYPGSRSPFVHIDTGNVRHWPRMSRKQLAKVFPRGNTVHVPRDGKPFKGYKQAKATAAKRKAEMIRTTRAARRFTQVAKAAPSRPIKRNPVRVASATPAAAEQKNSSSLLGRLLNRAPKEPPKPTFNAETPATSAPEIEAPVASFPQRLAALPRRADRPAVALAANAPAQPAQPATADASADAIVAAAEAAEAKAAAEAEATPQEQATSSPIQFASLPRSRPADASRAPFQLASAEPAKPLPQATPEPEAAQQTPPAPVVQPEAAQALPAAEPAVLTNEPEQAGRVEVAALQQANNKIESTTQDAKSVLNQLTGTEQTEDSGSVVRSAYASADASLSGLPTAAPRARVIVEPKEDRTTLAALPRKADRQELASLPTDLKERIGVPREMMATLPRRATRAAPKQPAPAPAQRSSRGAEAQLAKLTFAYGPTGMSHFAHMKQSTRTATFARLSRPIPNNLGALVSKPSSIVDQTFGSRPQVPQDVRFAGRAIARLAVRSFN